MDEEKELILIVVDAPRWTEAELAEMAVCAARHDRAVNTLAATMQAQFDELREREGAGARYAIEAGLYGLFDTLDRDQLDVLCATAMLRVAGWEEKE